MHHDADLEQQVNRQHRRMNKAQLIFILNINYISIYDHLFKINCILSYTFHTLYSIA